MYCVRRFDMIPNVERYSCWEVTYFSGQCSTVKKNTGCFSSADGLTKVCYCNSDLCNNFLAHTSTNETSSNATLSSCYQYSSDISNMTMCSGSCMTTTKKYVWKECAAYQRSGCEYVDVDYPHYCVIDFCYCDVSDNCYHNSLAGNINGLCTTELLSCFLVVVLSLLMYSNKFFV